MTKNRRGGRGGNETAARGEDRRIERLGVGRGTYAVEMKRRLVGPDKRTKNTYTRIMNNVNALCHYIFCT